MSLRLSVVMPVYNERFLVVEAIRRVLALESPILSRLDLIVVDDGSTDGTRELIRELAEKHPDRITYLEHERNQGKGAAVRTGIAHAEGDVTVIQDADLEYHPEDLPKLLVPFEREEADAVFGSRFLASEYRRVLYFRHTLANRVLTTLSNLLTNLNLTDMETCYKAVNTRLLKSIPIRSRDFRIEPELTFKLAKRGARIFEVPIRYSGRTYEEGKKIGFRDALLALGAMLRFWAIDDLYAGRYQGAPAISGAPSFGRWLGDVIRPFGGRSVLEIGAGIGNLTRTLLPRDRYTASDVDPRHLDTLRGQLETRPYLNVEQVDVAEPEDFFTLLESYDTVLCLNLLEHMPDEDVAVRNLASALRPDGRAIVLVPQHPALFGSLDEAAGHQRRYTRATLRDALERNGLEVEQILDFDRASVPAWWWNGRVLERRQLGRLQLKLLDVLVPALRLVDPWLPWGGVSLIAVGRRPA